MKFLSRLIVPKRQLNNIIARSNGVSLPRQPNVNVNLDFSIDVNISPSLQSLINNNQDIAPEAIREGLRKITRQAPKNVRRKVKSLGLVDTGRLTKSITGRTNKKKSAIGSTHFVGHILENGAKPHKIKAKPGKSLFIPGAKGPIKSVNHPGVRAYRYLDGTLDEMQSSGEISSLFAQGVEEAIDKIQNKGF